MIAPIIVLSAGVVLLARSIRKHGFRVAHLTLFTMLVGAVLVSTLNLLGFPIGVLVAACGFIGYRRLISARSVTVAKRAAKSMSTIGLAVASIVPVVSFVVPALHGVTDTSPSNLAQAPVLQGVQNISQVNPAQLSVVSGGDRSDPVVASVANSDPQVPAVRTGKITPTWTSLDGLLGGDANYVTCAQKVLPDFNWDKEVPKFKSKEGNNNARFIVVINSDLGQATNLAKAENTARAKASADTGQDLSAAGVVFTDFIINTRNFSAGGCEPFRDTKSQIRVSLGQLVFNADGTVSIEGDNGIFVDCHNPWMIPRTTSAATTTSTTKLATTTSSSSTTSSSTTSSTSSSSTTSSSTTTSTTRPPSTTSSTSTSSTSSSTTSTTVPPSTTTSTSSSSTTSSSTTTSTTRPPSTTTTVVATTTTKPPTSVDCQQNGTGPNCPFLPVQQPVQNNTTSGVSTGSTPGAGSVAPTPSASGLTPQPNNPTPNPVVPSTGGAPSIDSGSGSGSGTPGGTRCDTASCSGNGPTSAAPGPPVTGNTSNHTTDPGLGDF